MGFTSVKHKLPKGIERSIPFNGDRSSEVIVVDIRGAVYMSHYIIIDDGRGWWESQTAYLWPIIGWTNKPENDELNHLKKLYYESL